MSNKFNEIINNTLSHVSDISKRTITNNHGEICILYIKQLTDRTMLSNFIIKPLIEYSSVKEVLSAQDLTNRILYVDDCNFDKDKSKITDYLLNGMTVVLFSWDEVYLIVNIKKVESKNIESPELNYTLRGPRDSFTENLDTNLSLIRYRIKDQKLKIQMLQVGERTKARVAVSYIEDIANQKIRDDILQRISNLKIDGISESGELQALLLNNRFNLFPQMGLVERSDMACNAMLEGKIVIIVEGSCLALVAPKTYKEFLTSGDDY